MGRLMTWGHVSGFEEICVLGDTKQITSHLSSSWGLFTRDSFHFQAINEKQPGEANIQVKSTHPRTSLSFVINQHFN